MKSKLFLGILALFLSRMAVAQDLDYTGITRLRISGERFSLTVRGEPGDRLTGAVKGDPRDNVQISRSGNTLSIKVDNGWNIFQAGPRDPATMDISVPFTCSLDLETASGSIHVEDLDAGSLALRSASGSITMTDVGRGGEITTSSGGITVSGAAGLLTLESTSGSIKARDLLQGLRAETSSGSVEAVNVTGALSLTSVSGSLTLRNWMSPAESRFSTVSGSIKGSGLDAARFRIRGSTVSGPARLWGGVYKGSFRTGSGPVPLEVTTVSGSISLE